MLHNFIGQYENKQWNISKIWVKLENVHQNKLYVLENSCLMYVTRLCGAELLSFFQVPYGKQSLSLTAAL